MLKKLINTWWKALIKPQEIKAGEYSFRQMLIVSFMLGVIYCAGKYPLVENKTVTLLQSLYLMEFWVNTLWGGSAAVFMWLFTSQVGFYGIKKLGKTISYSQIEHLVFSSMIIWIIPLILTLVFGYRLLELTPYFNYTSTLIPAALLASFMTYQIFRKALCFDLTESLLASLLIVPVAYILPKWFWSKITWELAYLTYGMSLTVKSAVGIAFATLISWGCFRVRGGML